MNYQTSDFYLAVTLDTLGFNFVGVEGNSARKSFVFTNVDENTLQSVIDSYWDDKLIVSPKSFVDSIKKLKARLYETPNITK